MTFLTGKDLPPGLVKASHAAFLLGVTLPQVHQLMEQGKLANVSMTSGHYTSMESILRFQAGQEPEGNQRGRINAPE